MTLSSRAIPAKPVQECKTDSGTESLFPIVLAHQWNTLNSMLDAETLKTAQLTERRSVYIRTESVFEYLVNANKFALVDKITQPERRLILPEHLTVTDGRARGSYLANMIYTCSRQSHSPYERYLNLFLDKSLLAADALLCGSIGAPDSYDLFAYDTISAALKQKFYAYCETKCKEAIGKHDEPAAKKWLQVLRGRISLAAVMEAVNTLLANRQELDFKQRFHSILLYVGLTQAKKLPKQEALRQFIYPELKNAKSKADLLAMHAMILDHKDLSDLFKSIHLFSIHRDPWDAFKEQVQEVVNVKEGELEKLDKKPVVSVRGAIK